MKKLGMFAFIGALVLGIIIASVFSIGKFSVNLFSSHEKVAGSGVVVTSDREVSEFNAIDVSGAFKVEVTLQRDFAIQIESDDNLLPFIKTEVEGETLEIESDKRISSANPIIVRISAPSLESLEVSGASTIEVINVKSDSFNVDSSGASKIKLEGIATNLTIDSSGASIIDAEYLKSVNAVIDSSGASKIYVFVSSSLEADLSGASNLYYAGSPEHLTKKTSGASCVREKK